MKYLLLAQRMMLSVAVGGAFLMCCNARADDPEYVGVTEEDINSVGAWTLAGWKCKELAACPANAVKFDPQSGNVAGCTSDGAMPPKTCYGTCTVCEGSGVGGNMCERGSPNDTCSSGTSSMACGRRSDQSCMAGGLSAGANGCGCATPSTWLPNTTCKFVECQL